jgi:hypothetical protein
VHDQQIVGRFSRLIEILHAYLGVGSLLGGGLLFSAVLALAARATKLLSPYSPFSWVLAAALGVLIFTLIVLAAVLVKNWFLAVSIKTRFYKEKDRLNPPQDTFREQRINIVDCVLPYDRIIRNKTFIGCELIWPANVALLATRSGVGNLTDCEYLFTKGAVVKGGICIPAAIVLQECQLIRCRLCDLLLLIPEEQYAHVSGHIPDLKWITPLPNGAKI